MHMNSGPECALSQSMCKMLLDYIQANLISEDEEDDNVLHPLFHLYVSAVHYILMHHRKDLHSRAVDLLLFLTQCIELCTKRGEVGTL